MSAADPPAWPGTALLQISDPHFGTERPAVVQALRALAQRLRPALVVLSGDVTQRATPAQYAAAERFVQALDAPVLAVPGNHDIPLLNLWARAWKPYARFQQAFGATLEPQYEDARWLVLGVKTTRRWRHKHGEVSPGQVERVAARLRQAGPGQARVVVVHQPIAVAHARDAPDLLRGHALARRRWAEAGADVVMGGHIHLPYVMDLHAQDAPAARRLWCVQAGTAVSARVRREAGNSVNVLLRSGTGGLCVQRWDYRETTDAFDCVQQHRLELDRG